MRLFTGIAIAPHAMDNLARVLRELSPLAPLKWSPVENLHITSKFIGAWPPERLTELEGALGNVQFGRGFEIAVARFGYFPNPHHPRALFAAVQPVAELAELAGRIEEILEPLGIEKEERSYSPHVTLARIHREDVRKLREQIAKMTNFDFGTFQVSEFHLYSSKTGPGSSIYTPLSTYPLLTSASIPA
jgi:2'-5' RNA ligase